MSPEIESHEKISNAICMLLSHQPGVGFILLQFDFAPSHDVPIMGVCLKEYSTRINCVYNPNEIANLTVEEIVAVLQHEVAHAMQCHCQRRADRDPELWNIACDMVVNGKKSKPRIGLKTASQDFPIIPYRESLIWIPEEMNENQTAEEYYTWLDVQRAFNPSIVFQMGRTLDDHSAWNVDDSDECNAEFVASALRHRQERFVQPGSNAGTDSDEFSEVLTISEVNSSEVPWNVVLRRALARTLNSASRRASYVRRNRRCPMLGVPGHQRFRKPVVNIVLDVSGSVNSYMLGQFFSEIKRVGSRIRINLLLWDVRHRGFYKDFNANLWKSIPFRGGGGTDMAAPLCWLEENNHVRDLVVLFTDGFVFEWKKKSPWPLVTVIVGSQAGPDWGTTIHIQPEALKGVF